MVRKTIFSRWDSGPVLQILYESGETSRHTVWCLDGRLAGASPVSRTKRCGRLGKLENPLLLGRRHSGFDSPVAYHKFCRCGGVGIHSALKMRRESIGVQISSSAPSTARWVSGQNQHTANVPNLRVPSVRIGF